MKSSHSFKPWLQPLFTVAGIAFIVWLLSKLSRVELLAALARVGPWALLTLPLAASWLFANAMALHAFLPSTVSRLALWRNRFVSEGYNNILPLLGLGGEGLKVRHLAREVPLERAVGATVAERVVDAVVGLWQPAVAVALGAWLLPLTPVGRDAAWWSAAGSAALGLLALVALATPWPYRALARLQARVFRPRRDDGAAPTTPPTLAPRPRLDARATLRAVAWMLVGNALGLGELALILWRLGHTPSLLTCIFLQGAFGIAGTIAWPVPGNVGVNEAASLLLFEWLGLPAADGMALALVRRARLVAVSSFGVALFALERRRASDSNDDLRSRS